MIEFAAQRFQCFIKTCTGDLAKENKDKSYQEKYERFNMEE
jgi:hypothetical protein